MDERMPPVIYGPGYGKPQPEVHVTTSVLITDVQCRSCGRWVETWLPQEQVEADAEGYSIPPEHDCE